MLRADRSFDFNGVAFMIYEGDAGDMLPIHSHDFNHLTRCEAGRIETIDDSGPVKQAGPGEAPFEYRAGRRHGVRCLENGTRFVNIFPKAMPHD